MKETAFILALGIVLAAPALADDTLELEGTAIIGNRELPKVLYIVPWKPATPGDLSLTPPTDLLAQEVAPVDRDVFRRRLRYYDALHAAE